MRREQMGMTIKRAAEVAAASGFEISTHKLRRWEREGLDPANAFEQIVAAYGYYSERLVRNLWDDRYLKSAEVLRESSTEGFPHHRDRVRELTLRTSDAAIDSALMEPMLLDLEPGQRSSEELATHIGEEILYVVEGCAIFHFRPRNSAVSEKVELSPGGMVHFNSTTPHRLANEAGGTLRVLVVKAPPDRYSDATFQESDE